MVYFENYRKLKAKTLNINSEKCLNLYEIFVGINSVSLYVRMMELRLVRLDD